MIRSLEELPAGDQFIPSELILGVPVQGTPLDQPCDHCCRWWVPIFAMYARQKETNIAFHYEEWLIWHIHTIHHQGLGGKLP